jgi:hypothetical protein
MQETGKSDARNDKKKVRWRTANPDEAQTKNSRARPFHDYGAVMFIMGLRDFPGAASDSPRDRIHIASRLPASASGNKTSFCRTCAAHLSKSKRRSALVFSHRQTVVLLAIVVTVLFIRGTFIMENLDQFKLPSTAANVTVRCHGPVKGYRPREYLTEREIEGLMKAAQRQSPGPSGRHGYPHCLPSRAAGLDLTTGRLHVRRAKGGLTSVHPIGCQGKPCSAAPAAGNADAEPVCIRQ